MDERDLKEMVRKTFDAVAEDYDNTTMRFFTDSVPQLVSYLNLTGDERILDVATGTGHAAIGLANHVPGGQVCGIDFSRGMLAKAEEKKKAAGRENIQFMEMDMQSMQLPDDHFDRVVCSFGIFFIEDMVGQIIHMAEKAKPGGRIAITSFGEHLFSPQEGLFLKRLENYGVEIPPKTRRHTDSMSKCKALFKTAGLVDVHSFQHDLSYHLAQPELWWDILWKAGYRGLIGQLSEEDLPRFKKEHLAEVAAISDDRGLWLEIQVIYTLGTKAHP